MRNVGRFLPEFQINNRWVGYNHPAYIIAEAGVSHFGDEDKAYRLVDLAVEARADAIKFQIFDVNELYTPEATEWKERLGSRQLSYDAFGRIQDYCNAKGITFFATAHDAPSLAYLASLDVPVFKIGSGEVGNWPFLKSIAALQKPVIFSTGMYSDQQISEALDLFESAGAEALAMLHCVTEYPTAPENAGLAKISRLKTAFDVVVGYSDHTRGHHIPTAAAALGIAVIEKHITLDYDVPNAQDWKVACGPEDLARFISDVRDVEAAMRPVASELTEGERKSIAWAGKRVVLKRSQEAGHLLKPEDLAFKRPGTGIPPSKVDSIIGKRLVMPVAADTTLTWEALGE